MSPHSRAGFPRRRIGRLMMVAFHGAPVAEHQTRRSVPTRPLLRSAGCSVPVQGRVLHVDRTGSVHEKQVPRAAVRLLAARIQFQPLPGMPEPGGCALRAHGEVGPVHDVLDHDPPAFPSFLRRQSAARFGAEQRASGLLGPAVGTGHDTNTGGTQRRRDGQAARSAPRFRPAGSARPHADRRGEPAAGILTTWQHTGGLPRLSCAENVLRSPPATSPARATPPRMRRSQSRAWPRQARRRSRA